MDRACSPPSAHTAWLTGRPDAHNLCGMGGTAPALPAPLRSYPIFFLPHGQRGAVPVVPQI